MPSAMRTLEQERARYAYQCVKGVKQERFAGEYRTIAVKAPSYILTNGLGQTLAFLRSKPDHRHFQELYRHLSEWVGEKVGTNDDLLEWIVNTADSHQYRLATIEALALLQWLKQFAEAMLPKPKGREE